MTLTNCIKRLERMLQRDGEIVLDRMQAQYLIFLLWAIHDGDELKYSLLDFAGSLPDDHERLEGA